MSRNDNDERQAISTNCALYGEKEPEVTLRQMIWWNRGDKGYDDDMVSFIS